ncbi:phosphoribosyltransferase domain-containing protein [Nocardioides sp. NPDC000441]
MRDEASGWSGTWVAERLGVRLRTTDAPSGMMLTDLVGLAVRRNPRRAQLLVSSVLGKHVPTDPRLVTDAGLRLGAKARAAVTGDAVVLGYAETATALGHLVADALGAPYLHSTRRVVDGIESVADFYEEHSHATAHRL